MLQMRKRTVAQEKLNSKNNHIKENVYLFSKNKDIQSSIEVLAQCHLLCESKIFYRYFYKRTVPRLFILIQFLSIFSYH